MELRALRYFVTVAEELHFGRAAQRLGIVQPAVSQQVARLERELGVRLLDRSPRTVRLTDAGHRVLGAARDALASAEQVRAAAGNSASTVRIGTAPGLTTRLEHGIDALRERHQAFEIVLVDLPVPARLKALRDGKLDLAVARGTVTEPGLRTLPAWSEPLHVVVSTRHPAAGRDAIALGEMTGDTLRIPAPECDPLLHNAIRTALREAGVHPRFGRPTGTVENTMIELGADPRSWTLLPADLIARSGSTRVRAIPTDPAITIPGTVIAPEHPKPRHCVEATLAAFAQGTLAQNDNVF